MMEKWKKIPLWLILFLLIVPAFYQLARPGFFWMQDDLQAFRIHQMDRCFRDFQIPCRWVPDAGYQYGYPQFNFYPPGVYYLGELIHLVGFQFIDTVKILFILGFIFAAFAMFLLLKSLFGPFPALVGAAMYTYAPYKAVDVYVRGALSEFWAFVFFPLIFWSIYEFIKSEKLKHLVFFALSTGGLLLTHSLMSMIFLPLVGIWAIIWLVLEKRWGILPKLLAGGLLGFSLAAFFVLPQIIEKPYTHSESMLGGYFDWRQHFVDIKQLFISNHWGYGSSYLGPGDDLSLSAGVLHWPAALIGVFLAVFFYKKKKKISLMAAVLVLVNLGTLFLTHQKSSFIWERISLFTWLQFPWRFLADSVFVLSLLSAATIFLIPKQKWAYILGTVLIIAVFVLHANFFKPYQWFDISDKEKFSGILWEKELTISIFDYLPIFATLPPTRKAPDFPEVLEGKADFLKYDKGSHWQKGEVEVLETALIRLPLFDFPGMEVFDNGQRVEHQHGDCRGQEFCLGLINFHLPPGKHIIEARLTNTPVRILGNSLTAIGLFAVLVLFVKSKNEKVYS